MANLEQLTTEEKKENRKLLSALGIIVVIVAAMAIIGFLFINKPAEIIEGQAEATSVRVSGKLPGRIMTFYVHGICQRWCIYTRRLWKQSCNKPAACSKQHRQ